MAESTGLEIAIVALAGRFPGAADVEQFWDNLAAGVDGVIDLDSADLDAAGVDPELRRHPDFVARAGVLDHEDLFDAEFFEMSPREAEILDPQHRHFLECAHDALERAGYDPTRWDGLIGVFAGTGMSRYMLSNVLADRELAGTLGLVQLELGSDKDYLASQVSYRLNLRGPSVVVQSACSTSLVATHLACQSLLNGECDMALAGGVRISVPQRMGYVWEPGGLSSRDGRCRAFDSDADGIIGGNAVGAVVLKRLEDALADGDQVHAVIRGSAINNDGSQRVGFTAPGVAGQIGVIRAAQQMAEIEPSELGFIEAHGSATPLGDQIEIAALKEVFGANGNASECALGAVKSNVGHTGEAAGITGLIKTTLAVEKGRIPPTLHLRRPNSELQDSGLFVADQLCDWPLAGSTRIAGVSSFGLGGTNAHVVLESAPEPSPTSPSARPFHQLLLSARTPAALEVMTHRLGERLAGGDLDLADVAYTLTVGRRRFSHRRLIVCQHREEASAALSGKAPERLVAAHHEGGDRPITFLLPGLGEHYPRMAEDLYRWEPVFRRELERCRDALSADLGLDLIAMLYPSREASEPPAAGLDLKAMLGRAGQVAEPAWLRDTAAVHAALFSIEVALARQWASWGIEPQAMLGYSLGEYVCAHLAGVWSLEDALRIVVARARLIEGLPAGGMLAVPEAATSLQPRLGEGVWLAALNGPGMSVVAGAEEPLAELEARLVGEGSAVRRLTASRAFHTPSMAPAAAPLRALLAEIDAQPPEIPFLSNVTGRWIEPQQATDPEYWCRHLVQPVRFADAVAELQREPRRILLEVGPGQNLVSLAHQASVTEERESWVAFGSLRRAYEHDDDQKVLLTALGKLWLAGVEPDWQAFYGEERRRRVQLPTYPFEHRRYWVEPATSGNRQTAVSDPAERLPRRRWLSLPSWRRAVSLAEHPAPVAGTWWVFADAEGRAVELARHLGGADARQVVFGLEEADDSRTEGELRVDPGGEGLERTLRQALEAGAPDRVLYAWSSGPERGSDEELERAFYLPLRLARALGGYIDNPCHWTLLSDGVWEVESADQVVTARSALIAFQRVLPLEHAVWSCALVDQGRVAGDDETWLDRLATEAGAVGSLRIALRGHHRYRPAFEPVLVPEVPPTPLRRGGAYLITGGLGGIGLGLAVHLWRRHGARLALIGRTAVPPPEEWLAAAETAEEPLRSRLSQLVELRQEGAELVVLAADVTDQSAVDAAVATARRAFGDLDGVIHAAGVPGGGLIQVKERDQAHAVIAPKIAGAICLERALRGTRLDFFALFSSLVVHAGGIGQVDYCAANALLVGFARAARRRGLPAVAVDWCSWQWDAWGGELLGFDPRVAEAFRVGREKYGLSFEEGAWALEAALGCGEAQVMVATQDPKHLTEGEINVAEALAALAAERAEQRHTRPALGTEYVAPRNAGEERLAELWQDLLGIDAVGVYDDFFQLGGHSLLGIQLVARIRQQLQVELLLEELFAAPTLAQLAQAVEQANEQADGQAGATPTLADLTPVTRDQVLPLSFAQERLWFLEQLIPEGSAYNLGSALQLRGRLSIQRLAWAVDELCQRHEVLRTRFVAVDGVPVQEVDPESRVFLRRIDLGRLTEGDRQTELQRLAEVEIVRPFDLTSGVLLRMTLVVLATDRYGLLTAIHHIISDAWTLDLLVTELAALYNASAAGQPAALPPLPVQFADFAWHQRERLAGDRLERQLESWAEALAGAPTALELPTDRPRPAVTSRRGGHIDVQLPASLAERLARLGRERDATLYMVVLASFSTLLARFSGQREMLIGSPISGRQYPELEALIGFFVNTLVMRVDLSGRPTFDRLLARVREMAIRAYDHQDFPFERLVEKLQPDRDLSRSPLFQVMLGLYASSAEQADLGGVVQEPLESPIRFTQFDLTLYLNEPDLGGHLEYSTDLFDRSTIHRLLGQLRNLLAAVADEPARSLGELELLSAAERQQLLVEWGTGEVSGSRGLIHELCADTARRQPSATAVIDADRQWSYAELEERIAALSAAIGAAGVRPEGLVGLYVERSAEMVAALCAVLSAGAAYVPLDPAFPVERLRYMIADAGLALLVCDGPLPAGLESGSCPVLRLDRPLPEVTAAVPRPACTPQSLAYVIYTSGSTGRPKGVQIEHGAVVNFLRSMARSPGLDGADTLVAVTTLSFDIAVLEIFLTLAAGGRLVIADRETASDGARLAALLERHEATVLQATPATWQMLLDRGWPARPVRALCGGEALPAELAAELLARDAELWNLYGPTETTVWSAVAKIEEPRSITLGRPIAGTDLLVLDRELRPVPLGAAGELVIGGYGLARGYRHRPALTAERFAPHPRTTAGERVYRTGDLVRLRADGRLHFLGRVDHQVKVRGFRIELGEIENVLAGHPAVRECAVVARRGAQLVAYWVAAGESWPTDDELRELLARRLPAYMLPAFFVHLDELPRTPNRKVDRKALPAPSLVATGDGWEGPRTPFEEMICGVWEDLLEVDDVGRHNSFFELGGHSLLATRAISRLTAVLAVEIPMRQLFQTPTPAGLAGYLESAQRPAAGAQIPALVPVSDAGGERRMAASFAQERQWFLYQLDRDSTAYHVVGAVRILGAFEATVLSAVFSHLARRHETLRTTFTEADGEVLQNVAAAAPWAVPRIDLRRLPAAAADREMQARLQAIAATPFDLERGPLLRVALLTLADSEHALLLSMHHIVSDGWSMDLMVREIAELYRASVDDRPPALPELPVQYVDYARWERAWLSDRALADQLDYWREVLGESSEALALATDSPRSEAETFCACQIERAFGPTLSSALEGLARGHQATLFMVLLAAFQTLLARYTGARAVTVGAPIAHRNRLEVEHLIGLFVNTLVLRVELGDDPHFEELLGRARHVTLGAYDHQDLPFERLVAELGGERDLRRTPFFQVLLQLQNTSQGRLQLGEELQLASIPLASSATEFDLSLTFDQAGDRLESIFLYRRDLFDATTIERLADHLRRLLEDAVRHPDRRLSQLAMMSPAELHQVTVEERAPRPGGVAAATIPELFARAVEHHQATPALVCGDVGWSYLQLDEATDRLAARLAALGVEPEQRVGLLLGRGAEAILAMLAVLKTGAAYVPLDPGLPDDRLQRMLRQASVRVLISLSQLDDRLPACGVRRLVVDRPPATDEQAVAPPTVQPWSDNLCYLIFTSGSTGLPKGVAVAHGALANHGLAIAQRHRLGPGDRALQLASPSFDLAAEEIFPLLISGGTVEVVPEGLRQSPDELLQRLAASEVTILNLPTAYWHSWVEELSAEGPALPATLRLMTIGTEGARPDLWRLWRAHQGPVPELINAYGPTEATITATLFAAGDSTPRTSVPVGRPLSGVAVRVLDRRLRVVPVGIAGQLAIAGLGLARGYWGQPALTAEKFVPDPLACGGERIYATGDLARWLPDSQLEHLGRLDLQLKIRGFRVELGEIEAALVSCSAVREAAVVVAPAQGGPRLIAWVGCDPDRLREVRGHLNRSLPTYMLPSAIMPLPRLPQTPSGKIDRQALARRVVPENRREAVDGRSLNALEHQVAEIWAEVLAVDSVDATDSFFDLGGHSLLANRVISRLRSQLGLEVPLRRLFEHPCLEDFVAGLKQTGGPAQPDLVRVERPARLPLSFAQQRLWFLDRMQSNTPAYNLPASVRLAGQIAPEMLSAAMGHLFERHEVLRTRFEEHAGRPWQRIDPPSRLPLPAIDLGGLALEHRAIETRRLLRRDAARGFDLTRGPLLRTALILDSPGRSTLLLNMHHIVSDGWSMGVLTTELLELCSAYREARPPRLAELPVQYADYAVWQRSWLSGAELERQLEFWRDYLTGAPAALELPTDRPRPASWSYAGGVAWRRLPAPTATAAARLGVEHQATRFMVLLGAFAALLSRLSGQLDLVVGTPVANRNRTEVEPLIGFFVNTLALRIDLAGTLNFTELVQRVRDNSLGAYEHQELPFERLVQELGVERALDRSPVFQAMLAADDTGTATGAVEGWDIEPIEVHTGTAKFDLSLFAEPVEEGLELRCEFATALFDRVTVERLLRSYVAWLESAVAHPERPLNELAPLAASERQQLLFEWQAGAGSTGVADTLSALLEEHFVAHPHRVAVGATDGLLTYGDLDRRSLALASLLQQAGVVAETRVGVFLDRGLETVIALVAVLRCGGAYVPLDPGYPSERLRLIMDNAQPAVLLTRYALRQGVRALAGRAAVVWVDEAGNDVPAMAGKDRAPVDPRQIAYLIYTSGSTGQPKGVAIEHRAVAALIRWAGATFDARSFSGVLWSTSLNFDLSVFELFATLCHGGRVIVARDLLELPRISKRERITLINTVPSALGPVLRDGDLPAGLRQVNLAGEPLRRDLVDQVHRRAGDDCQVRNLYGPSEDTTYSTVSLPLPGETSEPAIGRTLPGTRGYLLDRGFRPLALGAVGELFLAGVGLARGYFGRPGATAERFVPDPFTARSGERMYRTGDLARWRHDGELEFFGRGDHQVKVRGFRIELGEIETALLAHDGVGEAVVVAMGDGVSRHLVGFYSDPRVSGRELFDHLRRRLPPQMVPSRLVALARLPRLPNGKLDRGSLAASSVESKEEAVVETSRTPLEELVAGVFRSVLGVESVDRRRSFFELGGHSLSATQVQARLREACGVEIELRGLFAGSTVEQLAQQIEELRESSAPAVEIAAGPLTGDLPLSFAQERLWFLDLLHPGTTAYSLPMTLQVTGDLDMAALYGALDRLSERHAILRTTFGRRDGQPVQRVAAPRALAITLVELTGLPAARRDAAARAALDSEVERPFDLRRGPLLRTVLVKMTPDSHLLLINSHHIISDGWSLGVLVRELSELYRGLTEDRRPALPPLEIQYPDYATWQRSWLAGGETERQLSFWLDTMSDAPAILELPLDRPRPAEWNYAGGERSIMLSRQLLDRLTQRAQEGGATLFMALTAAAGAFLGRLAGQPTVVLGSPIANRRWRQLEGLIGFFVNTLALRVDLEGEPCFAEMVKRVRDRALAAYDHQDLPFERLVEELGVERALDRSPMFQVMAMLQNIEQTLSEIPELTLETYQQPGSPTARFDQTWVFAASDEGLELKCEYSTALFDTTTIERWQRQFSHWLEAITAEPARGLFDVSFFGRAERQQLLVEWQAGADGAETADTLSELLEGRFAAHPDRIAAGSAAGCLTYGDLDRRSLALAARLQQAGIAAETRVGVLLDRELETLVALVAVLRCGGAYVPLDPGYPSERLRLIVDNARPAVLLTRRSLRQTVRPLAGGATVVWMDEALDGTQAPQHAARVPVDPRQIAYLIYTSGSTGQPKGVAIEHRAVAALIHWAGATFDAQSFSGVLWSTSLNFDLSVFELFATLCHGGRVIVARDLLELPRISRRERITLINTVPSALGQVLREGDLPDGLRRVNLAGEPLYRALVDQIHRRAGDDCEVRNLYGPSEDTTYSTASRVLPGEASEPAIGRGLPRTHAYLLDRCLRSLPLGTVGELFLAGAGLARGYFGRPGATAERFVPDPLAKRGGERMYRTGDLARWRRDGELEFLGRGDHQVKVRGFRIELGEVEAALLTHGKVEEAVVVAMGDGASRHLVGFYTPRQVADRELFDHLRRRLPSQMVPSRLIGLAELPRLPNGKLDRGSLAAPRAELDDVAAAEEPRTPLEELVAGVFCGVLGVEAVGRRRSFFELGGHSLSATQVQARLRDACGVEIELRGLFAGSTVEQVAQQIESKRQSSPPATALVPGSLDGDLPLSFAQERLWFLDQLHPGTAAYSLPVVLRVTGALALAALHGALGRLSERHAALRTTFSTRDGEPVQRVEAPQPLALTLVELTGLPEARRSATARAALDAEVRRPFDLRTGPLLRIVLVKTAPDSHLLLINSHHIVSDGWSLGVLVRELSTLYRVALEDQPSVLPRLEIQYPDYAAWQRSWLAGEEMERQLSFWLDTLNDAPPTLELPLDRPRPVEWSYAGGERSIVLSRPLLDLLTQRAQESGATLFMALIAAAGAYLGRLADQREVVLGSPIANRRWRQLEGLIGFFVNTLALRVDLQGESGFARLVERVRHQALAAYDHQDLPFERMVEKLGVPRTLDRSPVFQVMVALQNLDQTLVEIPGLTLETYEQAGPAVAKFDQSWVFVASDEGLELQCIYSSALFDATTIERSLKQFNRWLEAITAAPGRGLVEVPLFGQAERQQLLHEWNDSGLAEDLLGPWTELFGEWAEKAPDRLAAVFDETAVSYGELARLGAVAAAALRRLGVGRGDRVGLHLGPSPERLATLLGTNQLDAAWVPLEPTYPIDRLRFMADDAMLGVVVSDKENGDRLAAPGRQVVRLKALLESVVSEPAISTPPAELPAYVIYTSGSTGRPKGVVLSHGGLSNLIAAQRRVLELRPADRVVQFSSFSFDASVWETVMALAHGGTLLLGERQDLLPGPGLARWAERYRLDFATLPPSALTVMSPTDLAGLRALIVAGEALPLEVARSWSRRLGRSLINAYGPTEGTVCSTLEICREPLADVPPIGRPISNYVTRVLDSTLRPVPAGVTGELVIGGLGLAQGYLGRAALTAQSFFPRDDGREAGSRFYRTGDRVRQSADGRLQFLGRIDHQVKLRGVRIELLEIESQLVEHSSVRQAAAGVWRGSTSDARLVAWVVAENGAEISEVELQAFLAERLPEAMVPAKLIGLVEMPLNASGKVDRKALPAPTWEGGERIAPRDEIELELCRVWSEVLKVERLGVTENFFALGGHSLLAVRLLARIESELGFELPLSVLFAAPTVEQMATTLRRAGARRSVSQASRSPLVTIRSGGALEPWFCVHPVGGNVLCYAELAAELGPEQPIYGLQSPEQPLATHTVEELARHYLEELRSTRLAGPRYLCGWSMGAWVSFEMARQLEIAGQPLTRLVLLDPQVPAADHGFSAVPEGAELLAAFAYDLLGGDPELDGLLQDASDLDDLDRLIALAHQHGALPPEIGRRDVDRLLTTFRANVGAMAAYHPGAYHGAIELCLARDRVADWRDAAASLTTGGLEVVELDGDHYSILRPPLVVGLAQRLRRST